MNIKISQLKKLVEIAEKLNCKEIETLYYQGKLEVELEMNENNNVLITFHDGQPELTEIVHTKRNKL